MNIVCRPCVKAFLLTLTAALCAGVTPLALGVGITNCPDVAPALDVSSATQAVCSEAGLKAAIVSSRETNGGNGKVSLPPNCSITLTSRIEVIDDLTIDGNGVTLSGNNATQIFDIGRNYLKDRGVYFALQNATLINDRDAGAGAGAINNGGGAIFQDGLQPLGYPPVIGSPGGYTPVGYQRDSYGKGRFCGVLFTGNTVGNLHDSNNTGKTGGGLFRYVYVPVAANPVSGGDTLVEIERSMFDGNRAYGGGGALHLGGNGNTDDASVRDSVFRNNRAGGGAGGAISMYERNANFSNITLADNCINTGGNTVDCSGSSNSDGTGGGIGTWSGRYNVDHATVVRNRAAAYSGALNQNSTAGKTGALTNSILSANTSGNSFGVAKNCSNPVFTNGANSYQWQALSARNTADPYDPGCGAATENIDPLVSATPTVCTGRIAGSSFSNAPMVVFLPGQPAVLAGAAGAACPDSVAAKKPANLTSILMLLLD